MLHGDRVQLYFVSKALDSSSGLLPIVSHAERWPTSAAARPPVMQVLECLCTICEYLGATLLFVRYSPQNPCRLAAGSSGQADSSDWHDFFCMGMASFLCADRLHGVVICRLARIARNRRPC